MSASNQKTDKFLPGPWPPRRTSSSTGRILALRTGLVVLAVFAYTFSWRAPYGIGPHNHNSQQVNADICPQVSELNPKSNGALWKTLDDTYGRDAFKMRAVDWIAGAVRIP